MDIFVTMELNRFENNFHHQKKKEEKEQVEVEDNRILVDSARLIWKTLIAAVAEIVAGTAVVVVVNFDVVDDDNLIFS